MLSFRNWPLRRKIVVVSGCVVVIGATAIAGVGAYGSWAYQHETSWSSMDASTTFTATPAAPADESTVTASPTPTVVATPHAGAAVPGDATKPVGRTASGGGSSSGGSSSGDGPKSGGGTTEPPATTKPSTPPVAPSPTTWTPTQAEVDAAVVSATGAIPLASFKPTADTGGCSDANSGSYTGGTGPAYDGVDPLRRAGSTLAYTAHPITDGLFVQYYSCYPS